MLELKNLVFEVSDEKGRRVRILDDVSLTVPDGKFYVITGPNGGGKSTLARVIMGLEKPTSGKIIYNGTDITDMDVTEKAKLGIGYAFQQPPRFKGLTVSKMLSGRLGIGFVDHIRYLRCQYAANLIKRTDKSLTEISYECGFGSTRSFNRAFIATFGLTPTEYRQDGIPI